VILAFHLVWTAYGWWFPNDPRGAWSKEVWKPALREFGDIEERGRKAIQPALMQMQWWLKNAQQGLKHKPVLLDNRAREIARNAIQSIARLHHYEALALAVMPEHAHIVVKQHAHRYERMVAGFKAVSSRELRKYLGLGAGFSRRDRRGLKSAAKLIPIWSRGYWVRYLDTEGAVSSAIAYVKNQNSRF
jgi:REP element-mobilizing transposase RayT